MTAEPSQATPVDFAALLARCQGNLDFAEQLLGRFEARLGSDLEQLEQELAQQDAGSVARVAHRLKGACANVAAKPLEKLAERVEELGRHGELTEVFELTEALRAEQLRLEAHNQALINAGSQ